MPPTKPTPVPQPGGPGRADDAAVRRAAATWFTRANSGDMDAQDHARLASWLREDPRHAYEYSALRAIWDAAATVPASRLRALAEAPAPGLRPALSPGRRRALGLSLAGIAAGVGVIAWRAPRESTLAVATQPGERREIALPDGSRADLDAGTQLQARFGPVRRDIALAAGEAVFDVRHAPERPFIVDTGLGSVRVTGTRFAVRRDQDRVRVVVLSGSVEVTPAQAGPALTLTAGQAVTIDAAGALGTPGTFDPQQALAWRRGQIVFQDTPLAEAVREVSRYRAAPITLAADPRLAPLRLTSVFRTDDPDIFLTALPHALPVRVQRHADGSASIHARTHP